MTDVSYAPGNRTAIVADNCWALVDAPPDAAAVTGLWQRIRRAPRLDALLAGLLQDGLDHVPDFTLLAAAGGGRHHLVCRGRVGATLVPGSSSDGQPPGRVDGTGLVTWLERAVDAAAMRLPAAAGMLLAHSVIVDLTAPGGSAHPGTVTSAAPAAAVGATYLDTITITHPGTARHLSQGRPAGPVSPTADAPAGEMSGLAETIYADGFGVGATGTATGAAVGGKLPAAAYLHVTRPDGTRSIQVARGTATTGRGPVPARFPSVAEAIAWLLA